MMAETTVNVENNKTVGEQETSGRSGVYDGSIKLNKDYVKSTLGVLKLVELLLGILCMALSSWWWSGWFVFVAITSFIVTLIWLGVYLLSIPGAVDVPFSWTLSDLVTAAFQAFCYFIATIVMFSMVLQHYGPARASNTAAAVFGLCNTCVYGYNALLLFKERKAATSSASRG